MLAKNFLEIITLSGLCLFSGVAGKAGQIKQGVHHRSLVLSDQQDGLYALKRGYKTASFLVFVPFKDPLDKRIKEFSRAKFYFTDWTKLWRLKHTPYIRHDFSCRKYDWSPKDSFTHQSFERWLTSQRIKNLRFYRALYFFEKNISYAVNLKEFWVRFLGPEMVGKGEDVNNRYFWLIKKLRSLETVFLNTYGMRKQIQLSRMFQSLNFAVNFEKVASFAEADLHFLVLPLQLCAKLPHLLRLKIKCPMPLNSRASFPEKGWAAWAKKLKFFEIIEEGGMYQWAATTFKNLVQELQGEELRPYLRLGSYKAIEYEGLGKIRAVNMSTWSKPYDR